jgi:predicted Zn finger-like uncharacterized protein
MAAPEASQVVIACPHCGTRYHVPYAAIGAKGRTVACAHCGQSWEARAARPPRQKGFDELAEEALDEKMVAEERRQLARREASLRAETAAREAKVRARAAAVAAAEVRAAAKAADAVPSREEPADAAAHRRTIDEMKAAVAPKPDPVPLDAAAHKRQQHEFSQRQIDLHARLPMARMRRLARLAALVAVLAVGGGGVLLRGPIVEQLPGLAGVYAAIGLAVNVVGLEFQGVRTLKSLQQGAEVLVVDGKVRSVASHEVILPQVIVTLLGAEGESLYEWSVSPKATELEPGEVVAFETRLTAPPAGARGVRLTFATARMQSKPAAAGSTAMVAVPAGSAVDKAPAAVGDAKGKQ